MSKSYMKITKFVKQIPADRKYIAEGSLRNVNEYIKEYSGTAISGTRASIHPRNANTFPKITENIHLIIILFLISNQLVARVTHFLLR